MVIHRFEIYLTRLDSAVGVEMQKTRPCVIISPQQMHASVRNVIVAPLTSSQTPYPTRVPCRFDGKNGQVALDHIRALDRMRLVKRLGLMDARTSEQIARTLVQMFSY